MIPDAIDKSAEFAQININNLLVFLSIVLVVAFIGLMFLVWRLSKLINRPADAANTSALITAIAEQTKTLADAVKRFADSQDIILRLQESSQEGTKAAQKSNEALMEMARQQQREFITAITTLNNNIIGVKNFQERTAALSARIGDVGTSIDELSEKVKMSDEIIASVVDELKAIKEDMAKLRAEMMASREVTEETKRKIEAMDAKLQLILDRMTTVTAPPSSVPEPPPAASPKETL